MLTVLKRAWVVVTVVAAAILGGLGVLHFRGVFGSDEIFIQPTGTEAIVSVNVKHVVYEIFGPPNTVGAVSYLDEGSDTRQARFAGLPWTHALTTTLPVVVAHLVAQGDSDSIGCRITVNGAVQDEQNSLGHHAQTFCLVKAA
ncbi:MmpS family transport accessory protein [Mycolicibacillus trivialis]